MKYRLLNGILIITLVILVGCEPVKEVTCTPEQALAYLQSLNMSMHENKTNTSQIILIPLDETLQNDTNQSKPAAPQHELLIPPGPVKENVLPQIPSKVVTEGDLVSFPNLKARDPDEDPLSFRFTPPLNNDGVWQTKQGDAGEYRVTITVSDGKTQEQQDVMIIVKRKNKAPRIMPIKNITVREGDVLNIKPKVSDPDNDTVNLSFSNFATSMPYQVTFKDAGDHTLRITASDGELESFDEVHIHVTDVNRAPSIEPLADVEIREGELVIIQPKAQDPDEDQLTFLFSKPLNKSGMWKTRVGDKGSYHVNVSVTDGVLRNKTMLRIVVKSSNTKPILEGLQNLSVKEGEIISLDVSARDPDGDNLTITYTGYMNNAQKKVGYSDQGMHEVVIRASDGKDEVSETIYIQVSDVNRPPVFNPGAFR
ncbi:MAG: hypothetical protein AABX52_00475 [Nanoarchaeota archaeon]